VHGEIKGGLVPIGANTKLDRPMHAQVLPERPTIFLGQPFRIQLSITDVAEPFDQLAAQVIGTVRPLKSHASRYVQSLLPPDHPVPQPIYFDHVKSELRILPMAATFQITITATKVPPAYEGSSLEVSYKLLVRGRTAAKLSDPHIFPLVIVTPLNSSVTFSEARINGQITLEFLATQTVSSRVCLACPFRENPAAAASFRLERNQRDIAIVEIAPVVAAGDVLEFTIHLPDEALIIRVAELKIMRREVFPDSTVDSSEVFSRPLFLKGLAARRFSFQIPFGMTASFATEVAAVSYELRFVLAVGGAPLPLTIPLTVTPPLISLTKPRCPKVE
jgi:hypothetical protein